MSETQDVKNHQAKQEDVCSSEIESKNKDEQIGKEIQIESPKETMPENNSDVEKQGEQHQQQQQQQQADEKVKSPCSNDGAPRRVAGECRLLPVLVDLRSSLETNMTQSDSASIVEPKLDFNYFHDLCTSDLKTALSRLEDTLKRVDLNALTKYTSTLEPSDKFHLLQLISTLVSNLKKAKVDDNINEQPIITNSRCSIRKRANRHTIGVSSEELASARRWLEQERGVLPVKIVAKTLSKVIPQPEVETGTTLSPEISTNSLRSSDCPWGITVVNKTCDKQMKDAINQKQFLQHKIKESTFADPSNESLHSKSDETAMNFVQQQQQQEQGRRLLSDNNKSISNEESSNDTIINGNSKSNKFLAKKTKIKRANTIDIPNYLKMQAEKQQMQGSGGSGLRKPIDISDKVTWNKFSGGTAQTIPSFQAKTENDRKFLALINRNNENQQQENWSNVSPSSIPFKSFNYRQIDSVADKNWKSRFSNIKTAFDRPQSNTSSVSSSPASSIFGSVALTSRRNSKDFHGGFLKNHEEECLPKFEPKNLHRHLEETGGFDRVAIVSKRFSAPSKIDSDTIFSQPQTTQSAKNPAFTHAATSPFKKVSCFSKTEAGSKFEHNKCPKSVEKPISSCYLPACASSGLLKAKLKMFDNQSQPQVPKPFNNAIPQSYQPRNCKRDNNNKYQQFYSNHDDEIRLNNLRKPPDNLQHVTSKQSDDERLNHNYQSVAVQTSARSTPKPSTPPPELMIQEAAFYKPPETKEFYAESENPLYVPPIANINILPSKTTHFYENIENQDIAEDQIITRYTAAIATVANSCEDQIKPGQPLILKDDMHNYPTINDYPLTSSIITNHLEDDAQRHNILQLSLIKKIQNQTIAAAAAGDNELRFLPPDPKPEPELEPRSEPEPEPEPEPKPKPEPEPLFIGINNTQDKINIFEEKCQKLPKINVTSPPTKIITPPSFLSVNAKASMDSSDEYLVSCSNRPRRSIVLSKSESWHQLALAAVPGCSKHLQVPSAVNKPPPKPSSSLSSIKHYDPTNQLKKMEEKVQRYFNNSGTTSFSSHRNDNQQSSTSLNSTSSSQMIVKSEPKITKRSFSPRKMPNALVRSQTMPHVFDETFDVDKAFDSLFEEATRDGRY